MSSRAPIALARVPAVLERHVPDAAVVIAVVSLVYAIFGVGVLSIPGLAISAVLATAVLAALLYAAPEVLVVVTPALLPLGTVVSIFFPFEFSFAALALILGLQGIRRRAAWMVRLEWIEAANLGFIAWAVFTGFWCFDFAWYVHGVRRLLEGFAAFWVANRLARVVPRSTFEVGLLLGALALSLAALGKWLSTGWNVEQTAFHRAAATDLGWGTANYIATLLLLLSPLLLEAAMHSRQRWLRLPSWLALVLIALMQGLIASRAAALLFVFGTAVQAFANRSRKLIGALLITAALFGFVISPLGQSFLSRFTSSRELASIAVRIWYFRVAWQRTVDHFPWGMGLNQGWTYPDRLFDRDPHNYWLALSSELGLLGVAGWLSVLVLLWRRLSALASDPDWQGVGRALMVSFCLGQLHTLVEPTFQGEQYQFVFFWIMGGYLGYYSMSRGARSRAPAQDAPASSTR